MIIAPAVCRAGRAVRCMPPAAPLQLREAEKNMFWLFGT
jgi:hypothetical protein